MKYIVIVLMALAPAVHDIANAQSRFDCEANLIATNKAIEGAVQSEIDARKARVTIATGAGCGIFTLAVLGADLGLSTLICTIAMAGVYTTLTIEERSNIANRVFYQVRDRRCLRR